MGLVGSLEDLSLLDILQIVNVSKRTGVLKLKPREETDFYIYFSGGKITEILGGFDETSFIDVFEKQGLIDSEEKQEVLRLSKGEPSRAIEIMLDSNYVNEKLLQQARRQELSKRLKHLIRECKEGEFAFFLEQEGEVSGAPHNFLPLLEPLPPQALLTQGFIEESSERIAPSKPITPKEKEVEPQKEKKEEILQQQHQAEEIEELTEKDVEVVHPEEPQEKNEEKSVKPELTPPMPRIHPAKSSLTIILAAEESIFKNILWQKLVDHFSYVERVSTLGDYIKLTKALLEKKRPVLVIADLLMPTSDGKGYTGGLEILDESRKQFPEIKVILLSDIADSLMDDIALSKGAICVERKPELSRLKLDEIENAIEEFAERLSEKIDELLPPPEEELTSFFKDLGAEPTPAGLRVRDQLGLLKGLLGELANPKESSEISLLVLRLASEYFERAILLLVKRDEIIGLGGFGVTGDKETMSRKVARLKVPFNASKAWKKVIEEKATVVSKSEEETFADADFFHSIGPVIPKECVNIPMVSRGRVIAILYADNAVSGEPLPDLSAIEIFMIQAGIAMERALLERQLLSLKKGLKRGDTKDE